MRLKFAILFFFIGELLFALSSTINEISNHLKSLTGTLSGLGNASMEQDSLPVK